MNESSGVDRLSQREIQVAQEYVGGASYGEIAERLFIAPTTVRTHLRTIYRKLGVSTKLALLEALRSRDDQGSVSNPAMPAPLSRSLMGRPDRLGPANRQGPLTLRGRRVDNAFNGPSVVVLPFRFLGGDPLEWLADGLTEDITTGLSRFHELFVIARNSAHVFGDAAVSPSKAARELGVRYAATGSVRKAGPRIRVTIQLLDGERERTVWGEQYDRQLDDLFDLQQEITELIVSAMAASIAASERERLRQLAPSDVDAYTYVLQGQQHIYRYTREDNARARSLYEAALELDPRYARALAATSRTLNLDWRYNWSELHDLALDKALDLALAAVDLDPKDARGYGELGFARLYRKEHEAAISAYRRALSLNPNDADLMSDFADTLAHCGQSEEAIELIHKAMRLNPFYPDDYLWSLGGAYYNLKRYEDAIQAASSMHNSQEGHRILAASHAQLGRMSAARTHAEKVLKAHPGFSLDHWQKIQPDRHSDDTLHFIEGLKKAGL